MRFAPRSSRIATSRSDSTFTPERMRARIQSTGTMSGIAAATAASGRPAAPSTSGNTMRPASGTPAMPTPAMMDASTIVIWCVSDRS